MKLFRIYFTFSFIFLSAVLFAQKKALNPDVYDDWQSIGQNDLTYDGKWVGYMIRPQEGDNQLDLYSVSNDHKISFPRGERLSFTSDSKFAVFQIKPFYKDIKAVKDKKLKKDKLAKDSLGFVNLSTEKVEKISNVKSYQVPEKGGSWLVYLQADPKDNAESEDKKEESSSTPSTLVLMNLESGKKTEYKNVIRYLISENGTSLAYITQNPKENKKQKEQEEKEKWEEFKEKEPVAENENKPETEEEEKTSVKDKSAPQPYPTSTVNWVNISDGKEKKLAEGKADFRELSFDKQGNQLSFVGSFSAKNDLVKDYQLYYFTSEEESKIDNHHPDLPEGWVISENRQPLFSKDGSQLYFGIAPKPIPRDTALVASEHARLDIWNYKDDYLQSQQLKNLQRDLKKSYLSVLQTNNPNTFQPLSDEDIDRISLIDEGNAKYVLGSTNKDSRIATQWRGSDRKTYYLIDNLTGEKTKVVENLYGNAIVSPLGNYVVYFDIEAGAWYSYQVKSKQTIRLDKTISVSLVDELWDMPDDPRAYGIAGFTDGDESVIIKDRYDLWEISLTGKKAPRNITAGYGRKNKITFNTYRFDPEVRSINRNSTIYLSGFYDESKNEGIFKTQISKSQKPTLVYGGKFSGLRTLKKAKNADEYIFVKGNYEQSPNLFATSNFSDFKQLSNTNPQQSQYNWATSELVYWTTPKGYHATGVLYKPENFDPNKKYPMIVYFYERLSDNLNRYQPPAPTPSRLDITYFASNGYLVFTPDIAYEDGHPGESAVEYINSGVKNLAKNSWVDEKHIGIQGQSWGGYQVAYLITDTDMYAAAWSGAPVVNMTSAYGGIRWSSGMNRQFQYEKTQSRIGKTLWEAPELYIENSPLFQLPKVKTPVVIMSNDNDGAVPWWQGIEMFTALRRLGKPVWLLNYNGEEHNLIKRENRKDISIREKQFFDHYLKGAKAPVWMTRGIPATMKGKDWGFELTDEKP